MYTSDYLYGMVHQQRHTELMGDAAERRMARTARVLKRRPVAGRWQRFLVSLGLARSASASRRPARLQSVRP